MRSPSLSSTCGMWSTNAPLALGSPRHPPFSCSKFQSRPMTTCEAQSTFTASCYVATYSSALCGGSFSTTTQATFRFWDSAITGLGLTSSSNQVDAFPTLCPLKSLAMSEWPGDHEFNRGLCRHGLHPRRPDTLTQVGYLDSRRCKHPPINAYSF